MTNGYRKKRVAEVSKPTRYYSKRQENYISQSLGGVTHKNSGATLFQKGDISTNDFLIECKTSTTRKKTTTIHKEWLTKVRDESIFMNKKYFALAFNFGDDTNYFIIDERTFKELLGV